MKRLLATIGLAGVVAACGGDSSDVFPRVASHPAGIGVGEQRVLIGLFDASNNEMIADPDLEVVVTLRDRIGSPLAEAEGEFVWMIPDVRGLYAFHVDFPGSGEFQVTLETGRYGEVGPIRLMASENTPVVQVGADAPRSETRTIPDHELTDITSDPDPDPRFYEMTVAEALESGPSVIVFGTPAWCPSQACGPLLDQVKSMYDDYPGLNFVHVEIYDDIHVATEDELVFVPSVEEWGLVSEPIIFVTDSNGQVAASFEGAASENELANAFASVAP